MQRIHGFAIGACALVAACGGGSALPPSATYGPNPHLPPPAKQGFLPTILVPRAVGWPAGAMPKAAEGFTVSKYADALDHPRWLYVMPNGDVLVAESSTEAPKPKGFTAWVRYQIQKRAGALGESADRITLLRDADGDGAPETRSVFLENLNQPFGMALVGDSFYVGNTDAVVRFPYTAGAVRIETAGQTVMALPHSEEGHWTRNLLASPDGSKLYVAVGSQSNVADAGMEVEAGRAAIHELDLATGASRLYATGLRNPNGLAFEPTTGVIWTTVNERDMLGDDLVPDYMTGVKDGGFYGWPYSYYGQHPDGRAQPPRPDLVASAIVPDYALGAHTASLGLAFYEGAAFPARFTGGAFVGQHGSWNRSPISGYKVVFIPFAAGKPSGPAEDILTGFIDDKGQALGRPVGVAVDRTGALLVADDAGNTVWRVAPASPRP